MGNAAWINEGLGLNKTREWSAWRGSDGQVAGYFETYATAGKPLLASAHSSTARALSCTMTGREHGTHVSESSLHW